MANTTEKDGDRSDKDDEPENDDAREAAGQTEGASGTSKSAGAEERPVDEEDDEEDEDEEEDEEQPAPTKPSEPPKKTGAAAGKQPAKAPGASQGGLAKSMILFVVIVGTLAAGFAWLGKEEHVAPVKPKWNAGQQLDVELTLVPSDARDLACASSEELAGKHCAFEAKDKAWSKGESGDETKVFKPYTTTDRLQFLAAGVWSEPALKGKLPNTRFSVKCKYTVDGKLKRPAVRWNSDGPWHDQPEDWYAGSVSGCVLAP